MAARQLLVVATAPVEGETVGEEVRRHLGGADANVRIVAPASKISPLRWLVSDEDEARADARERAQEAADAAGDAEEVTEADARVGDTDPVTAIEDALRTFPADEILVLSPPGSEATWLEKDTAAEALGRFALPVTHVVVGGG